MIALLIGLVSLTPVFGFGIGGAFGLDIAGGTVGPGALLSFSLDTFPAVFGAGASFAGSTVAIGATADWWLYYANLVSILALYIGPGVYFDLHLQSENSRLGFGVRIPVGLQAWILDPLEAFLEIAPTLASEASSLPSACRRLSAPASGSNRDRCPTARSQQDRTAMTLI